MTGRRGTGAAGLENQKEVVNLITEQYTPTDSTTDSPRHMDNTSCWLSDETETISSSRWNLPFLYDPLICSLGFWDFSYYQGFVNSHTLCYVVQRITTDYHRVVFTWRHDKMTARCFIGHSLSSQQCIPSPVHKIRLLIRSTCRLHFKKYSGFIESYKRFTLHCGR